MASYRIVCTDQVPVSQPTTHAHIVAVGVGEDPDRTSQRFSLQDVLEKMARGDRFYTKGKTSGRIAEVESVICARCFRSTIIRSKADAVPDNNLDSLRRCG